MIDLHTHLLPGLDDGPRTVEASIELAKTMVADGTMIAACTPHVREDFPTTPAQMEVALETLRAHLAEARIPLDARAGGEIALDKFAELDPDARSRFGLAGNPRLLLLEFPYLGWPLTLPSILAELKASSVVALLAHPERNSEVQDEPDRLKPLIEAGAYVQLTAGSVDGSADAASGRCARTLIARGLAHVVASDAHGGSIRRSGLRSAKSAIGSEPLAAWLTEAVPRALIAGSLPPPRPAAAGRRWWRSDRRS
jgi:protein-tyrosine phosphatase